jgi:hypothetical protein
VGYLEDAMDDEKTVIEKFTDAMKGAASSIAHGASDAVGSVIKSNAARFSPDDVDQVAGAANEPILVPQTVDAGAMRVPSSDPVSRPRRKPKASAKATPAKIPRTPAVRPRKSKKPAAKAKVGAKSKAAAKKGKSMAGKTVKKNKKSGR